MHAYCVGELHLSEDAASKRIQVARKARELPALITVLAEGRVHLTGLRLLAPHLTPENVDELLAAATHRPKAEIERLIAQRFPGTELLQMVHALPNPQPAPGHVDDPETEPAGALAGEHAPGHVGAVVPPPKVAPLAPERFVLQLTIGKRTHDKLRSA